MLDDIKRDVKRLEYHFEARLSDLKSDQRREIQRLQSEIETLNYKHSDLEQRYTILNGVVDELINKINGIQNNQEESRESGAF